MRIGFLITAMVAGTVGFASAASSQTISARYCVGAGCNTFTTITDTNAGPAFAGSFSTNPNGFAVDINANATQPANLLSNSFQLVNGQAAVAQGPLTIQITSTGFTTGVTPSSLAGLTAFTGNINTGAFNISLASYYTAGNTAYGMGQLLGTATFSAMGSNSSNVPFFVLNNANPFTITEVYTITANASSGQSSASISVTATAVPAPVAGVGIFALLGLAGVVSAVRRRREQLAA